MRCCSVRILWRFVNLLDADGEDDNAREILMIVMIIKGVF